MSLHMREEVLTFERKSEYVYVRISCEIPEIYAWQTKATVSKSAGYY